MARHRHSWGVGRGLSLPTPDKKRNGDLQQSFLQLLLMCPLHSTRIWDAIVAPCLSQLSAQAVKPWPRWKRQQSFCTLIGMRKYRIKKIGMRSWKWKMKKTREKPHAAVVTNPLCLFEMLGVVFICLNKSSNGCLSVHFFLHVWKVLYVLQRKWKDLATFLSWFSLFAYFEFSFFSAASQIKIHFHPRLWFTLLWLKTIQEKII